MKKVDYTNESLRNGLKVLRALVDRTPSYGFSVKDLQKKTDLKYDQVYRALKTLEAEKFATQVKQGWKPGNGLRLFSAHVDFSFGFQDADILNLADSMRQI